MQRELVERARKGDHDAFTALAAAAIPRLDAAAWLILRDPEQAKDAVQNALVRAWRDLPTLRDPDRFDPWLRRLLVRACIDEARRTRRHQVDIEFIDLHQAAVAGPEPTVVDRDELARGFVLLGPEERALIVLRSLPRPAVARGGGRARYPARHREVPRPSRPPPAAGGARRRLARGPRRDGGPSGMTSDDRFEATIAEWLDAESAYHLPDSPGRGAWRRPRSPASGRAWSSLERWLPVQTDGSRRSPRPGSGWSAPRRPRPAIAVVGVALLAVGHRARTAAAARSGLAAQRRRSPTREAGDIYRYDIRRRGQRSPLIAGPTYDFGADVLAATAVDVLFLPRATTTADPPRPCWSPALDGSRRPRRSSRPDRSTATLVATGHRTAAGSSYSSQSPAATASINVVDVATGTDRPRSTSGRRPIVPVMASAGRTEDRRSEATASGGTRSSPSRPTDRRSPRSAAGRAPRDCDSTSDPVVIARGPSDVHLVEPSTASIGDRVTRLGRRALARACCST